MTPIQHFDSKQYRADRVINAITEWDQDLTDIDLDAFEALWESDHCPRTVALRDERLGDLLM